MHLFRSALILFQEGKPCGGETERVILDIQTF